MTGTDGGRLQGLVGEPTAYAALAAIDRAVQRALTARTESQRQCELAQLHGALLTLLTSGPDLEGALRHLIGVLQEPATDR
jgi:hypothetical protein